MCPHSDYSWGLNPAITYCKLRGTDTEQLKTRTADRKSLQQNSRIEEVIALGYLTKQPYGTRLI